MRRALSVVCIGLVACALTFVAGPALPAAAEGAAPTIVTQPVSIEGYYETYGYIQARVASSIGTPTVQWEFSPDGIDWSPAGSGSLGTAGAGQWNATYHVSFWTGFSGSFRATFTNADGSVTTDPATATTVPDAAPTIVAQPASATQPAGTSAVLLVSADAPASTTAVWEFSTDGTNWSNTGGTNLLRNPSTPKIALAQRSVTLGPSTVGYYRVRFTHPLGSATSQAAQLSIPGPPTVVTPLNTIAAVRASTGTVTLSTTFSGAVYGVQWSWVPYPSGTSFAIPPTTETATTSTVVLSLNQFIDRVYTARIIGPYGETTTSARVTIGIAPSVSPPTPSSLTVDIGAPVSFSWSVAGNPVTTRFERSTDGGSTWATVGTEQTGSGTKTYSFTATAGDNGARFRAVGTNPLGSSASPAGVLTVRPPTSPPTFLTKPNPVVVLSAANPTVAVTTTGANVTVTWYKSTCTFFPFCFPGAYTFTPVGQGPLINLTQFSEYSTCTDRAVQVVATNPYGSVSYQFDAHTESAVPSITTAAPPLQYYAPGVAFTPDGGTASCDSSSRWERSTDGSTWTSVSGSSFALTEEQTGTRYRKGFVNAMGTTFSQPITMRPVSDPTIEQQPASVATTAGSTATFTVGSAVSGVTYSWETKAPGASTFAAATTGTGQGTPTFNWPVTAADGGREFRLRAQTTYRQSGLNAFRTLYSDTASLTLAQAPTFTTQPQSTVTPVGSAAVLTVAVAGTPTPTVSWESSPDGVTWTTVPGETGLSLTVAVTASTVSGTRYRAVATNLVGSVTSEVASVSLPASQTITFPNLPTAPASGSSTTLAATASSGLPVSYTATGSCTVASDLLTFTVGGTCTVTASQPGDAAYLAAAAVARTTVVAKAAQVITFDPLPASPAVGTKTVLGAVSSSGLAVSYLASGGCSISSRTVTWTSVAPCTVTARQIGSTAFLPAPTVSRSTTPVAGAQTITIWAIPDPVQPGDTVIIKAAATSKLPVTLTTTGPCSIGGDAMTTLTILAPGTCTVIANQPGDASWNAAPTKTTSRIVKAHQTIDPGPLPIDPKVGTKTVLTGTATSGLTVSYTAAGGCTVSAKTVTWTRVETCTVTARQIGNAQYFAAPPVAVSTTPVSGDQTITLTGLPTTLRVGDTVTAKATASSKLPVSFSTTGGCTVIGHTVTVNSHGACTLFADQPGDANWNPAPTKSSIRIVKQGQTIAFEELPVAPTPGTTTILTATASSGLGVTYLAGGAGCSLAGRTVRWTTSGATCTITARQTGSSVWEAASVVRTTTTG